MKPSRLDLALFALLTVVGVAITLQPDSGESKWLDTLLVPAVTLPILIRRSHPLAAAAALAVGIVISGIPTFDQIRCGFVVPTSLIITFGAATRLDRPRALSALAIVLAGIAFLIPTDNILNDDPAGPILFIVPLVAGAWGAGRFARARDSVAAALAERSRMLTEQREQTAALAVEIERTRLSSDLDVATRARIHAIVDLAARQAAAANDDEDRRAAFTQIEREGRSVLNEMRELLGVLRSDERAERSPRPTLAQIGTLLEKARAGGGAARLDVQGEQRALPSSIELTAYRALQHGLVAIEADEENPATVRIRYLEDALELELIATPRDGSQARAAVAALRERVAANGGTFSSSRSESGLQVLRASLPVPVHA